MCKNPPPTLGRGVQYNSGVLFGSAIKSTKAKQWAYSLSLNAIRLVTDDFRGVCKALVQEDIADAQRGAIR